MTHDPSGPIGPEHAYAGRTARPDLEAEIVAELRARGALADPAGRVRAAALRTAAALALVAVGWAGGRLSAGAPELASSPRFALLLWEGPDFGRGAPAGSFTDEYRRWAAGLAEEGVRVRGAELTADRTLLAPAGSGDPDRGDVRLGGWFVVNAHDAEEAHDVARGHPHLRHGGWVEVVPVAR